MISLNFFVVLWLSFIISYTQSDSREDWVEPDVWGRSSPPSYNGLNQLCPNCQCEQQANVIENISLIYYKKVLKFLFNRNKFEFDENKDLYNRALLITITKSQIERLEKSTDPRDWDSIMNEIIPKVQTFTISEENKTSWIMKQMKKLFCFLKSIFFSFSLSEVRFELLLTIAILIVIYVKKVHGFSLAVILTFGMFFSGYVYKYYECNRQLEVDQLAELYDLQNNPCGDDWQNEPASIWNLWSLFRVKPSKAQCLEYLRKKNKLKLPFCRPDDVFFIYINEIILKQFQLTVEKSTHIFKDINQLIPFPYNIVASIIFCLTLLSFLKLFFKYILSPSVWYQHWSGPKCNQSNTSSHCHDHHDVDRLSGDNLRNFLDICKKQIESSTIKHKLENMSIVASGVQVLTDFREFNYRNANNEENENIKVTKARLSTLKNESKSDDETNHNDCATNNVEEEESKGANVVCIKCSSAASATNDKKEIPENFKKEKES